MRFSFIFLAVALFTSTFTYADPVYGVHIGSQHFPGKDYNNINPGAYVRYDSGFTLGAYYNSERRVSAYAGYTYEWGRFGITLGGITGYKRMAILPMVVPTLRLGQIGPATIRLAFLPKIEKSGATVIHFMAEF